MKVGFLILAVFLFTAFIRAKADEKAPEIQGSAQNLGGQLPEDYLDARYQKYSGSSAFVSDDVEDLEIDKAMVKQKHTPYVLPGNSPETEQTTGKVTLKDELNSFGVTLPGSMENNSNLVTYKDADILGKIKNESQTGISFSYVNDTYNYKDGKGTFQRTFENGTGAIKGGYLFFGFDRYYKKGTINYGWGGNLGVGFNRGKGFFLNTDGTISNEQSDANFNLWTLPVDLAFKVELMTTSLIKIAASAGPSVMGLYQTRSDRDQGEKGKRRRQIGFGYFGILALKTNLSILPKSLYDPFKMYSDNKVSRSSLDLFVRFHSYDNFQDQLTIDGVSFGLGFSFEYI